MRIIFPSSLLATSKRGIVAYEGGGFNELVQGYLRAGRQVVDRELTRFVV